MFSELETIDDFGWSVDWAIAMRECGDFDLAEEMLDVAYLDAFQEGFNQGEEVGIHTVLDDKAEEEYFETKYQSRCCE